MSIKIGSWVRVTDVARKRFGHGRLLCHGGDTGIVVGFGRRGSLRIRIRRNGRKTADSWHPMFWELDEDSPHIEEHW